MKKQRGPLIDGVKFGSTYRDGRSTLPIEAMKLKITGFTNDQATRVASFKTEMCPLWPPNLSGLSRGVVFYLGML